MSLRKVISGGQTGVDQAALRAARECLLNTGGTAPRGWRTLEGPAPWLASFGLVESGSPAYSTRTGMNVMNSDATLRIATDFGSPGERCTLTAINRWRKTHMDVTPLSLLGGSADSTEQFIHETVLWLITQKVMVLNVAGNSEKTSPGIYAWSFEFLAEVFERVSAHDRIAAGEFYGLGGGWLS